MSEKLTLEDIRALSDADIGEHLARNLGLRVHRGFDNRMFYVLVIKGIAVGHQCNVLAENLDNIANIEKLVIEKVGFSQYGFCLQIFLGLASETIRSEQVAEISTATARHRAEACLLALQGQEKNDE